MKEKKNLVISELEVDTNDMSILKDGRVHKEESGNRSRDKSRKENKWKM